MSTETPVIETTTEAKPEATKPVEANPSEPKDSSDGDSCTCVICDMRRGLGSTGSTGPRVARPTPGYSSFEEYLASRFEEGFNSATGEKTTPKEPAENRSQQGRSSFLASMFGLDSERDSDSVSVNVMGVRLPNGQVKVFSSPEEFSAFLKNFSQQERVPEHIRLFEEEEVIRRERALSKFNARQTAKTEKRRAKFLERHAARQNKK
jgi:hypothetical protein